MSLIRASIVSFSFVSQQDEGRLVAGGRGLGSQLGCGQADLELGTFSLEHRSFVCACVCVCVGIWVCICVF